MDNFLSLFIKNLDICKKKILILLEFFISFYTLYSVHSVTVYTLHTVYCAQ